MKTAIQELIHFIENDRMQSIYTKEQVLELLNFKLEKEKEQIIEANENKMPFISGNEYYNETFKSE